MLLCVVVVVGAVVVVVVVVVVVGLFEFPGKIVGHKAAPIAPIAIPTGKAMVSSCLDFDT